MAGFQLSGLASGFDWKTLVDQLIQVGRVPQDRLRTEKATLAQKTTAVTELSTAVGDLQTSLRALRTEGLFARRSISFTNATTAWTSSASAGAVAGDYQFAVSNLATRARLEGSADRGAALSATSDVSGTILSAMNVAQPVTAGQFTVNGARITVAVTDSLEDVFANIATATGGVVTGSYNATTDRIALSSSGTLTLGSANDTSNFLQAMKLNNNGTAAVASAAALGVTKLGVPIAQSGLRTAIGAVDGTGAGTFKINGAEIAYNVNTDSLAAVVARINASAAGVTASYDAVQDRFVLANQPTGDSGIFVEEVAGGLLGALGVSTGATLVRGENAEFTLNGGGTIVSTSNVLDETIHGIAGLSVTAASEATETVRVSSDAKESRTALDSFIAKFNAVQTLIEKQTRITSKDGKVTAAILSGNREITELGRSLRSLAFSAALSTGSVKRFADLGIDFKGTEAQLTIKDSAALNNKLASASADVTSFFTDTTNGLVARVDAFLEKQIGLNGGLPTQTAGMEKQSRSLDKQIEDLERNLISQRELLESKFIQMERAQSTIQQQTSILLNSFGNSDS